MKAMDMRLSITISSFFARHRRLGMVGAGTVLLVCLWLVGRVGQGIPAASNGRSTTSASLLGVSDRDDSYDYGSSARKPAEEVAVRPGQAIRSSAAQWPSSPQEQAAAMTGRLERVVEAVAQAAGSPCIPRLGLTGRGAVANGDGTITVDTATLWRLSEDALAALVAHEMAHDSLGHASLFKRLESEKNRPGYAQQMRNLEMAADEAAGRFLARTPYALSGVNEWLRQTRSTEPEAEAIYRYYSQMQRQAAFEQGFGRERSHLAAAAQTSRPAETADGRKTRGDRSIQESQP